MGYDALGQWTNTPSVVDKPTAAYSNYINQYPAANANTQGNTVMAPGGSPGANPVQPPNPPGIPGGSLTDAYNQVQNLAQNAPSSYDLYQQELKSRGIDTLIGQEADLGNSINEQEKALKPLLPENVAINFPKSLQQLQDIGVTQDQLSLLAAKERAPIASALADLLKSQSVIAQQIDRQTALSQHAAQLKQQDYQARLDAAKLQYTFAADQADRQFASSKDARDFALENSISTPFYFVGGEVRRTSDGKAYSTPEQFFKDAGVSSFEEASSRGMLSNATDSKVGQQSFENQLAIEKLNIDRYQATHSGGGGGPGLTPGQLLTFQNQIQDNMRLDPAVKSYSELVNFGVPTVIQRFQSGDVSNVSDTVLMRTLAKVTDPSTGVREEEYRTFEDSVGAINKVFTLPGKWVGKGRLTPEGRSQMIQEIQDRYNARLGEYVNSYQYYSGQAGQAGLNISPPYQVSNKDITTFRESQPNFVGPKTTTTKQVQSTSNEEQSQDFWSKIGNFLWGN